MCIYISESLIVFVEEKELPVQLIQDVLLEFFFLVIIKKNINHIFLTINLKRSWSLLTVIGR